MREQPSYRLIAAGVILAAYFVVAAILLAMLVSRDNWDWNQILVIFNAVGALATTAAGVLFGAEIQQANVRNALQTGQAHAAASARKDQAMMEALASLRTVGRIGRRGRRRGQCALDPAARARVGAASGGLTARGASVRRWARGAAGGAAPAT